MDPARRLAQPSPRPFRFALQQRDLARGLIEKYLMDLKVVGLLGD